MRPRANVPLSTLPIIVFERNHGGGSRVQGVVVVKD